MKFLRQIPENFSFKMWFPLKFYLSEARSDNLSGVPTPIVEQSSLWQVFFRPAQ